MFFLQPEAKGRIDEEICGGKIETELRGIKPREIKNDKP